MGSRTVGRGSLGTSFELFTRSWNLSGFIIRIESFGAKTTQKVPVSPVLGINRIRVASRLEKADSLITILRISSCLFLSPENEALRFDFKFNSKPLNFAEYTELWRNLI